MSYMLFTPGSALPKTRLFDIPHFDKIIHFSMFTGFAFLWLFDSRENSVKFSILVLILSLTFAAMSEIIQHFFIPGRSGNYLDFLADFSGLIVGLTMYYFFRKTRFFPDIPKRN